MWAKFNPVSTMETSTNSGGYADRSDCWAQISWPKCAETVFGHPPESKRWVNKWAASVQNNYFGTFHRHFWSQNIFFGLSTAADRAKIFFLNSHSAQIIPKYFFWISIQWRTSQNIFFGRSASSAQPNSVWAGRFALKSLPNNDDLENFIHQTITSWKY